jgi:iron complex outermembrane receptor protein
LLACTPALANNVDQLAELKRMSVDELLNVEVTSVSRHGEDLRDAAAAIAVITREDLRRTGVTSMPEALRLVPGIHVGRRNSNSWAVSSRGFSSVTSEKLLVLSDTRSIYTPLFSGVQWDIQDYLLEDVERVEVIRGPGAALWGSNAVNGVINITTRSARDTHGAYVEAGAGSFERYWAGARYGGETGGGVHYRVFGRFFDRDGTVGPNPAVDDAWNQGHVGFRTDWDSGEDDSWTVQGDAYAGDIGQFVPAITIIGRDPPPAPYKVDVSGGNVLARWRHRTGPASDIQLRAYYDYTRRDDPSFLDTLHTLDVDLQQRLEPIGRHELLWGVAVRQTSNNNRGDGIFAVNPEQSDDLLYSGFVQDQISLSDRLELTLGTKLEHNDFSGFEVQPSVRIAWAPTYEQTLWSSISRAVRVPTRLERDIAINLSGDPTQNPTLRLLGNPQFGSEELIAYEAGYRWQPLGNLSFDLAIYYNDYEKLSSLELGEPFVDPADGRTVFPIFNENLNSGRSIGAELLAEWAPFEYWRLSATYSHVDLELESMGQDLNRGVWFDGSTPRSMFGLRSLLTLSEQFELDAQFRHNSRIRRMPLEVSGEGIAAYSELDLRIGWRVTPRWHLSLVGQNLLNDEHVEFGSAESRGALQRAAHFKAEWRL